VCIAFSALWNDYTLPSNLLAACVDSLYCLWSAALSALQTADLARHRLCRFARHKDMGLTETVRDEVAGSLDRDVCVCALFACTDYENDFLFWVDTKQHVVVSSDLNGQKRSILLTSSRFLHHAVAITVFEVNFADCYSSSLSAAAVT